MWLRAVQLLLVLVLCTAEVTALTPRHHPFGHPSTLVEPLSEHHEVLPTGVALPVLPGTGPDWLVEDCSAPPAPLPEEILHVPRPC